MCLVYRVFYKNLDLKLVILRFGRFYRKVWIFRKIRKFGNIRFLFLYGNNGLKLGG